MQTSSNRIKLNLDSDSVVNVKGFIAPIEYTQYDFHVEWDELANLRVAEPEKHYPASVFQSFLPLILSILSSIGFTEYEPITQIALPEGALARLGKGQAEEIAFSPDGNLLAVAGSIGVWLYDVRTYKEISLPTGYMEDAICLAFSPDGNLLATGSKDGTILLFDPTVAE